MAHNLFLAGAALEIFPDSGVWFRRLIVRLPGDYRRK
jgi:hypothetical protein